MLFISPYVRYGGHGVQLLPRVATIDLTQGFSEKYYTPCLSYRTYLIII